MNDKILPLLIEAESLLRVELKTVMYDGKDRMELQTLAEALNNTSQAISDLLNCVSLEVI